MYYGDLNLVICVYSTFSLKCWFSEIFYVYVTSLVLYLANNFLKRVTKWKQIWKQFHILLPTPEKDSECEILQ